MRRRLYREGVATNDGRILENTTWSDEPLPLPLMLITDPGSPGPERFPRLIGMVTEVRREEDGWVTGELTTQENLDGLACQAEFDQVEVVNQNADIIKVSAARLRAVTMGQHPCWDDMLEEVRA